MSSVEKTESENLNHDLFALIESEDCEAVKTLICFGAEVKHDASLPLFIALYYGNIEMAKFLISYGADIKDLSKKDIETIVFMNKGLKKINAEELLDLGLDLSFLII